MDKMNKGTRRRITPKGPTPRIRGKKCYICSKPVYSNHSMYCPICRQFAVRMSAKRLPPSTIEDIWNYVRRYGYVCYYTGMSLDMENRKSPWYGVLDHWIPQNSKKVVLTSSLINEMKSDLTEKEFWYYIKQLYNCRVKHSKVKKIKLVYWDRLIGPGG